jgi:hypothetical protein
MPDSILVLPDSIGVLGEQPEICWQKTRPKEEKRRAYLPALMSASCRKSFFGNADVHAVWPKVSHLRSKVFALAVKAARAVNRRTDRTSDA